MVESSTVPEPIQFALQFSRRVLSRFLANKGLLLASAVSYNTLLSLIPLFALLLVILSHVYDEQRLADLLLTEFGALMPLEDAFAVIFSHRKGDRHLWVSAIIPYAFVSVMGIGLLLQAVLVTLLEDLSNSSISLVESHFTAAELSTAMISLFGFLSLAILFTGIYRFMPVAEVRLRHAAVGGLVAAILWELVRNILMWWFARVSLVNIVYGSLATVVIVLLTLEAAAIILLLGAQVIAELEPRPREPGLEPG